MLIRPFQPTDDDYVAANAVWNAVWPDNLETVDEMKHQDATSDPEKLFQRVVLVDDEGGIPAYGIYMESACRPTPTTDAAATGRVSTTTSSTSSPRGSR